MTHHDIFCYRDDISLVKQLVKKYGSLTWSSSVDASTSHVVSGEGKRTLNLLQGLLQGCWIVSKVIRCLSFYVYNDILMSGLGDGLSRVRAVGGGGEV